MIKKYEIENIIKNALEELDGMVSKPTYFTPEQKEPIYTVYEANVTNDENDNLIFTFKEDCTSDEYDKYKIQIELINKEEKK